MSFITAAASVVDFEAKKPSVSSDSELKKSCFIRSTVALSLGSQLFQPLVFHSLSTDPHRKNSQRLVITEAPPPTMCWDPQT